MKLFDSHAHIDDSVYDCDLDDMLKRARNHDVVAVMVAGVTPVTTKKALSVAHKYNRTAHNNQGSTGQSGKSDIEHPEVKGKTTDSDNISHKYPDIFISVGMHPHDAQYCSESIIDEYKTIALKNPLTVRAWGETGLDFNRMHSPRDVQEKWFLRQIDAADDLNLGLIFHERDSEGRFLQILESLKHRDRKGVVHCFSGTRQEMFRYLDLGYYIGITGILTLQQRGDMLRELAVLIPSDRIVIETDAPYLTPVPMKNKTRRNEPAFVRHVFNRLAEIKGEDTEALAEILWKNTCSLYDLSAGK